MTSLRHLTRALPAALGALLLMGCTADPPPQPPSPTLSFKTFDSSKYPGLNITSDPLPTKELELVEILAKHDLLLKTMAEKEPTSYAPLYEVMTKKEADPIAATIRKNHKDGFKSEGWGKQKILWARLTGDDTALIRSCADERAWRLIVERENEIEIRQGQPTRLSDIRFVKEDGVWKIDATDYSELRTHPDDGGKCK
ncbi:MAG: hypothetical protein ACRC0L_08400 [Angustibacter sp.]